MLETIEERVRLLKLGTDAKTIEKLYINLNNFKIINAPVLYDLIGSNEISRRNRFS